MGDSLQSRLAADEGQFSKQGLARFAVAAISKSFDSREIKYCPSGTENLPKRTVSSVVDQVVHGSKSFEIFSLRFF